MLPLAVAMLAPPGADTPAATIYRTTAPDGTVVFSDRPAADATVVRTRPLNVVGPEPDAGTNADDTDGRTARAAAERPEGTPPESDAEDGDEVTLELADEDAWQPPRDADAVEPSAGTLAPPLVPTGAAADAAGIESVTIASPPSGAVLPIGATSLLVEIGTAPRPLAGSGLRAEILLDGEVAARGGSRLLAVPAPMHGEYRLQARLVDAVGRIIVESATQTLRVLPEVAAGGASGGTRR